MKHQGVKMTVTLFVICVVVAAAMAAVNGITAPIIAENDARQLNESLRAVLEAADTFEKQDTAGEDEVYVAKAAGEKAGVCVVCTVSGYGGDVKVLTGILPDGTVSGVQILSHSETAGLGANAAKPDFLNQYSGKTAGISVEKNSPGENGIQAISGATITSKAVTEAVNKALETAQAYL
jgi:electron transport complex protein RnfG